ncbi:hypothetical protein A8C56_22855 [Niabella ginsenosidivorans]|uniref:Uncharacterized protein n=1 Tax=Niabella ginsenosidivorans TaxID=1176587 RepID=A0A1A9I9N7_9BACT|nr:hypothetical protein A8C56_22855 [Niabella ginsenosidivorans]
MHFKVTYINFEMQSTFNHKNSGMKISRTRFVIIFLVSAFAFVFITNLLLVPVNGEWFPGMDSPIGWKRTLANSIYPIKIVLVGPLAPIFNDPDPPPPIRMLACAIYWTVIAWVLYYLISLIRKIKVRKKI